MAAIPVDTSILRLLIDTHEITCRYAESGVPAHSRIGSFRPFAILSCDHIVRDVAPIWRLQEIDLGEADVKSSIVRLPFDRRARRIEAFHPLMRGYIEEAIGDSRPMEDLAESFPGLLFALSTGYARATDRRRTRDLVESGAPLRTAAGMLGIPYWLKRLPAQAFLEPLGRLPMGTDFAEKVGSFIPQDAEAARTWLWTVTAANEACSEDFALWAAAHAAKNTRALNQGRGEDIFLLVAAWAWHADHPSTPGHRLLRKPWVPTMGFRRAMEEMQIWHQRIALAECIAGQTGQRWPREGAALGFEFHALDTAEDLVAESDKMDNCLDQYAGRLKLGRSRIYSVRRNGLHVADVEIGMHEEEASMPGIRQLRGPRNRRAAPQIWQAAYAWLGQQPLRPLVKGTRAVQEARVRAVRAAFWAPYLSAVAGTASARRIRDIVLGLQDPAPERRAKRAAQRPATARTRARGDVVA